MLKEKMNPDEEAQPERIPLEQRLSRKDLTKVEKTIALIHGKVRIICGGVIDHDNLWLAAIVCAREAHKYLKGFTYAYRREIVIRVLVICLESFGVPAFAAEVGASELVALTDLIYRRNFHHFSITKAENRENGRCCCVIL